MKPVGALPASTMGVVSTFTRWVFFLFMFSIPFDVVVIPWLPEWIQGNLSIPRIMGLVLFLSVFSEKNLHSWKFPRAALWFSVFLVVYVGAVIRASDFEFMRIFQQVQLLILLVISYRLFVDLTIVRGALFSFVLSCTSVAALTIADPASNTRAYIDRLTAFNMDPNIYAGILIYGIVCIFGVIYVRKEGPPIPKWILWCFAGIITYVVGQTGSRGMTLALMVALATLALQYSGGWQKIKNFFFAGVAIVISVWLLLGSVNLIQRWELFVESRDTSGREVIYAEAWKMALERPLVGWGGDSTQILASRLGSRVYVRAAHSTPLTLLDTVGLLGTIPFYICYLLILRAAWSARKGPEGVLPFALFMGRVVMDLTLGGLPEKLECVFWAYQLAAARVVGQQNA